MAALFDTSVVVLLLTRSPPEEALRAIRAARIEIEGGGALLAAVAAAELGVGARTPEAARDLEGRLARIPTVSLPPEAARHAGAMGGFLRESGATVPLPDLLIAATAIWVDVPLLAWDREYARALEIATASKSDHPGAAQWRKLRLHPASLGA